MPSVVLASSQVTAIAAHFAVVQFVGTTVNSTANTAIVSMTDLQSGINTLAMSVSIGAGSISYSPAFSSPLTNLTIAQQSALICYMIQTAMGVPLIG